jgi:hypothetical protein
MGCPGCSLYKKPGPNGKPPFCRPQETPVNRLSHDDFEQPALDANRLMVWNGSPGKVQGKLPGPSIAGKATENVGQQELEPDHSVTPAESFNRLCWNDG